MYTMIMKKPKDLEVGDELVLLQPRGDGPETRICRVRELYWDNGDLFLKFSGDSNAGAQLRDAELYEPVLVVGSNV